MPGKLDAGSSRRRLGTVGDPGCRWLSLENQMWLSSSAHVFLLSQTRSQMLQDGCEALPASPEQSLRTHRWGRQRMELLDVSHETP